MKLWILKSRQKNRHVNDNPWRSRHDGQHRRLESRCHTVVVCAETSKLAREIAQANGGDEISWPTPVWTDPKYTTCSELTNKHKPGIVVRELWGYMVS